MSPLLLTPLAGTETGNRQRLFHGNACSLRPSRGQKPYREIREDCGILLAPYAPRGDRNRRLPNQIYRKDRLAPYAPRGDRNCHGDVKFLHLNLLLTPLAGTETEDYCLFRPSILDLLLTPLAGTETTCRKYRRCPRSPCSLRPSRGQKLVFMLEHRPYIHGTCSLRPSRGQKLLREPVYLTYFCLAPYAPRGDRNFCLVCLFLIIGTCSLRPSWGQKLSNEHVCIVHPTCSLRPSRGQKLTFTRLTLLPDQLAPYTPRGDRNN